MLFLLSRIKPQGTYETMRQIWDVLSRHEHEIVNFGTPTSRSGRWSVAHDGRPENVGGQPDDHGGFQGS